MKKIGDDKSPFGKEIRSWEGYTKISFSSKLHLVWDKRREPKIQVWMQTVLSKSGADTTVKGGRWCHQRMLDWMEAQPYHAIEMTLV